jgi:hypothetical protein
MTDSIERALRARFRALRAADDATAPAFERLVDPSLLERRRRQRRLRWRHGSMAMAVVAILAAVALRDRLRSVPDETLPFIDLGAVYWHAPSDFLLETPGRDLLRGVPTFTMTIEAPADVPEASPPAESTAGRQGRSES